MRHINHNDSRKQLSEDVAERYQHESEEHREIEHKADYGKKFLEYQTVFIYNRVEENRKTLIVYTYAVGIVLSIFLAFIWYCLYLNQHELVRKLFQCISYVVAIIAGFFIGKMTDEDNNGKRRFI